MLGGIILLKFKLKAEHISTLITPFAAGTLLAAAFLDLLKESAEAGSYEQGLMGALLGILAFFFLERFLSWFHHHHTHEHGVMKDPKINMIIIGDSLHNLIDGVAIGAAFIVSPQAGIVASLAVAAHEIPQEIGDFGLLLSKGLKKSKVLLLNLISAMLSTVSASLIFLLGNSREFNTSALLGLIAGMFIYIAVSDIIPEIHKKTSKKDVNISSVMLVLGVLVVIVLLQLLH